MSAIIDSPAMGESIRVVIPVKMGIEDVRRKKLDSCFSRNDSKRTRQAYSKIYNRVWGSTSPNIARLVPCTVVVGK